MRWTASVVRDVLPNGLTVLAQRDPAASTVAVVTHVSAGYFDEPDEWVGIAHLLEHMFFKGTPAAGPGVLARETQRLGGYLNAATAYDHTVYYVVVPSGHGRLERALALQADALRHAALDADEFAREREVVIQEANRKLDTPGAVAGETLYQLLFRVHRMRRWRIGTEDGLRRLSSGDLRRYYETRYHPQRVILSLAGDLDPEHALTAARAAYEDWRPAPAAVPAGPAEPDERSTALRILRGQVERPIVALGWRTVGPTHPDTPALDVAAAVLGLGRGSWLARAVRQTGLAAAVGSGHYTPGDVGVLDVSLTTEPARVAPALARAVSLAGRLADSGPGVDQLDRVRALLDAHWARRFESADGRATTLAAFEALGSYRLADEYAERIAALTVDDVREATARYVTDGACAVVYAPDDATLDLDPAGWPVAEASVAAPPAVPLASAATIGRAAAAGVGVAEGVRLEACPGADVLARRRPGSGLVTVACYLPGLADMESEETAGLSRLLTRVALRGAGGWSADALAARAEALGGSVAVAGDADVVGWTLTVPAARAAAAADVLWRVAAEPTLAANEVEIERALQAQDAARQRDDMYRHPMQQVLAQAFAGDAYGLPPLGVPERVRAYGADAVIGWQARALTRRAIVVCVGDLSEAELLGVGARFDRWRGEAGYVAPPAPSWRAGRGFETRRKAQTALALAFPAPPGADPSRHALIVGGALLSGLAGRLFDELRERRALAYTVQAGPWLRRRAGALLAYVATAPDREEEAREAMLAELARVAREEPDEAEVERARSYAAGLVAIGRQRGAAVASELADAWIHGTIATFPEEAARLGAVDGAAIRAAAAETFDPARYAEYVVRGVPPGATGDRSPA